MCSQRIEGGDARSEATVDEGRRAALAKMGVVAPAFVALMTLDAAEAWSSSGRPNPKPKPKPR